MKATILSVFLLTACAYKCLATTYYSVGNGDWGDNIWSSSCSTCAGGALPALVNGDIVIIDDQITIASGTVNVSASVTLIIRTDSSPNTATTPAELIFTTGGKLILGSGSAVFLENTTGDSTNDPVIDGSGSGGSNIIDIGTTEYWRASDGDIKGVGQLQPGGTLPITLVSFNGKVVSESGSVNLHWVTSREQNFNSFYVGRSANGKDFEVIGSLKGAGKNLYNVNSEYTFTDVFPLVGTNYYRLTALDSDGTSENFDIIAVAVDGKKEIAVYPNPLKSDQLKFRTNFDLLSSHNVVVTNAQGAVVFSMPFHGTEFVAPLDVPPGIYILRVVGRDIVRVSQILVE